MLFGHLNVFFRGISKSFAHFVVVVVELQEFSHLFCISECKFMGGLFSSSCPHNDCYVESVFCIRGQIQPLPPRAALGWLRACFLGENDARPQPCCLWQGKAWRYADRGHYPQP